VEREPIADVDCAVEVGGAVQLPSKPFIERSRTHVSLQRPQRRSGHAEGVQPPRSLGEQRPPEEPPLVGRDPCLDMKIAQRRSKTGLSGPGWHSMQSANPAAARSGGATLGREFAAGRTETDVQERLSAISRSCEHRSEFGLGWNPAEPHFRFA